MDLSEKYKPKFDKRSAVQTPRRAGRPYAVSLWASGLCNFKCQYCAQSLPGEAKAADGIPAKNMEWELFRTIAGQLQAFAQPVYSVIFCGVGEPLLNPRLPDMVAHLKSHGIVPHVEVVTNASLLTPEISRRLIGAGLDTLNISLQGVSRRKYREIACYDIDMEALTENIRFFYEHKNSCRVFIKTLDIALDDGDREIFLNRFAPLCDTIHVDCVTPLFKSVDYAGLGLTDAVKDQYTGQPINLDDDRPCPQIFTAAFILPTGDVVPCCLTPNPMVYGNVNDTPLREIWDSPARAAFLELHENYGRSQNPVCRRCVEPPIQSGGKP